MNRRIIAVVAACCLGVAALAVAGTRGGPAEGASRPEQVRLVLQWEPQAQFAGYYAAAEQGYYRDHGLDVEILSGGPGIDPIAELRSGRAEFATSFLSGAMTAAEEGEPLVCVSQIVNRSNLLLVARRGAVADRDALDGQRVSLWGTSFQAAYLGYFSTADVEPELVPQYYTVNLFLRGGVTACAAMEYNEYHTILQAGVNPDELTTFSLREAGFDFPEDGVYTLASTQRRSPGLCREFAAATLEGWQYCRDNPEKAVTMVMRRAQAEHVPTNRAHQDWMLEYVLRAVYPGENDSWQPGVLSRVDYERTRAIMIGEGQIAGAPSYERFVAPEARGAP